ncbi:MAG TPA: hypothetical protein VHK91_06875 [Flavisolibacter sp.]|jgi:hypothetical protein|nr:hypothetical protein [Flavisolibacter sp.]
MQNYNFVRLLRRATFFWLLFIPVIIINGFVRDLVYKPYTGDFTAHQISTVTAGAAFFLLACFFFRKHLAGSTLPQLFGIGSFWVLLTFLFETVAGHYLFGTSWERIFQDYDLASGHLWPLFLLLELLTLYGVSVTNGYHLQRTSATEKFDHNASI